MATKDSQSSSSSRRLRMGDTTVGAFRIEEEIGKGSFATVYKGCHRATSALVAIKSVNLSKLNKKLKENLYSEIDILKGIQHPHIVALIDCRESPTHIHLVMEYCLIGDLSYFIKKREKHHTNVVVADMVKKYPNPIGGGLNEVVVRHFLKQISSALEALRARNLIHRDIKPQNLLLTPSPLYMANTPDAPLIMSGTEKPTISSVGIESLPMLKIADFGFARSLPATSLAETLCGSPLYMAPEILRYEKYDAKADLWSVGTVLFEMMVGKPPFRASNHVELLRKIEQGNDHIKFPKESVVSEGMQDIIRSLLKRAPTARISFERFFNHDVIKETIPGLVREDRSKEIRAASKSDDTQAMHRQPSNRDTRRVGSERDNRTSEPSSPRPAQRDPAVGKRDDSQPMTRQLSGTPPRATVERNYSSSNPRQDVQNFKRPIGQPSPTIPTKLTMYQDQKPFPTAVDMVRKISRESPSPGSSLMNEQPLKDRNQQPKESRVTREEKERAAQDMAFEREYVVVNTEAVVVNALADEMAEKSKLPQSGQSPSPKMLRRATTQGAPHSATGAVPAQASRAVQIAQGKQRPEHQRQSSLETRRYTQSPTSAISKAIQGASLRLFGIGYTPQLIGRGYSPPQLYNPFPSYPPSNGLVGLLGDGRSSVAIDEDSKAVHIIEEAATVSDVVYGFAEVKYKQLIPLQPSLDYGLGGPTTPNNGEDAFIHDDFGLTPDAMVALSEEALVLYVKVLALLAKSMDIAGSWWARKHRGDVSTGSNFPRTETASTTAAGTRINQAVQWVRGRFNEVLEKAEFVRLKLLEAQQQLPEDHPMHPNNHTAASTVAGGTSTEGVHLSPGMSAEKLMYDRAVEMSRSAAINEITNVDLPGCERSYVTALRMFEAVLENDDITPQYYTGAIGSLEKRTDENTINGMSSGDRQEVQKMVQMVRERLRILRKKMAVIANVQHQSLPQHLSRPTIQRSGGATLTVTNTPPK